MDWFISLLAGLFIGLAYLAIHAGAFWLLEKRKRKAFR